MKRYSSLVLLGSLLLVSVGFAKNKDVLSIKKREPTSFNVSLIKECERLLVNKRDRSLTRMFICKERERELSASSFVALGYGKSVGKDLFRETILCFAGPAGGIYQQINYWLPNISPTKIIGVNVEAEARYVLEKVDLATTKALKNSICYDGNGEPLAD